MDITVDHQGQYKCVAENRAGESYMKFEVDVLCTHLRTEFCRQLEFRHITNQRLAYERRRAEYDANAILTTSDQYDSDFPFIINTHKRRHSVDRNHRRQHHERLKRRRHPYVLIDRMLPPIETISPLTANKPKLFLHENFMPPQKDPNSILFYNSPNLPEFKVDARFTEFRHKKLFTPKLTRKWDTQYKTNTNYNLNQDNVKFNPNNFYSRYDPIEDTLIMEDFYSKPEKKLESIWNKPKSYGSNMLIIGKEDEGNEMGTKLPHQKSPKLKIIRIEDELTDRVNLSTKLPPKNRIKITNIEDQYDVIDDQDLGSSTKLRNIELMTSLSPEDSFSTKLPLKNRIKITKIEDQYDIIDSESTTSLNTEGSFSTKSLSKSAAAQQYQNTRSTKKRRVLTYVKENLNLDDLDLTTIPNSESIHFNKLSTKNQVKIKGTSSSSPQFPSNNRIQLKTSEDEYVIKDDESTTTQQYQRSRSKTRIQLKTSEDEYVIKDDQNLGSSTKLPSEKRRILTDVEEQIFIDDVESTTSQNAEDIHFTNPSANIDGTSSFSTKLPSKNRIQLKTNEDKYVINDDDSTTTQQYQRSRSITPFSENIDDTKTGPLDSSQKTTQILSTTLPPEKHRILTDVEQNLNLDDLDMTTSQNEEGIHFTNPSANIDGTSSFSTKLPSKNRIQLKTSEDEYVIKNDDSTTNLQDEKNTYTAKTRSFTKLPSHSSQKTTPILLTTLSSPMSLTETEYNPTTSPKSVFSHKENSTPSSKHRIKVINKEDSYNIEDAELKTTLPSHSSQRNEKESRRTTPIRVTILPSEKHLINKETTTLQYNEGTRSIQNLIGITTTASFSNKPSSKHKIKLINKEDSYNIENAELKTTLPSHSSQRNEKESRQITPNRVTILPSEKHLINKETTTFRHNEDIRSTQNPIGITTTAYSSNKLPSKNRIQLKTSEDEYVIKNDDSTTNLQDEKNPYTAKTRSFTKLPSHSSQKTTPILLTTLSSEKRRILTDVEQNLNLDDLDLTTASSSNKPSSKHRIKVINKEDSYNMEDADLKTTLPSHSSRRNEEASRKTTSNRLTSNEKTIRFNDEHSLSTQNLIGITTTASSSNKPSSKHKIKLINKEDSYNIEDADLKTVLPLHSSQKTTQILSTTLPSEKRRILTDVEQNLNLDDLDLTTASSSNKPSSKHRKLINKEDSYNIEDDKKTTQNHESLMSSTTKHQTLTNEKDKSTANPNLEETLSIKPSSKHHIKLVNIESEESIFDITTDIHDKDGSSTQKSSQTTPDRVISIENNKEKSTLRYKDSLSTENFGIKTTESSPNKPSSKHRIKLLNIESEENIEGLTTETHHKDGSSTKKNHETTPSRLTSNEKTIRFNDEHSLSTKNPSIKTTVSSLNKSPSKHRKLINKEDSYNIEDAELTTILPSQTSQKNEKDATRLSTQSPSKERLTEHNPTVSSRSVISHEKRSTPSSKHRIKLVHLEDRIEKVELTTGRTLKINPFTTLSHSTRLTEHNPTVSPKSVISHEENSKTSSKHRVKLVNLENQINIEDVELTTDRTLKSNPSTTLSSPKRLTEQNPTVSPKSVISHEQNSRPSLKHRVKLVNVNEEVKIEDVESTTTQTLKSNPFTTLSPSKRLTEQNPTVSSKSVFSHEENSKTYSKNRVKLVNLEDQYGIEESTTGRTFKSNPFTTLSSPKRPIETEQNPTVSPKSVISHKENSRPSLKHRVKLLNVNEEITTKMYNKGSRPTKKNYHTTPESFTSTQKTTKFNYENVHSTNRHQILTDVEQNLNLDDIELTTAFSPNKPLSTHQMKLVNIENIEKSTIVLNSKKSNRITSEGFTSTEKTTKFNYEHVHSTKRNRILSDVEQTLNLDDIELTTSLSSNKPSSKLIEDETNIKNTESSNEIYNKGSRPTQSSTRKHQIVTNVENNYHVEDGKLTTKPNYGVNLKIESPSKSRMKLNNIENGDNSHRLSSSLPSNKLTINIPGDKSSRPSKNNIKIKSNEDEYVINEDESTKNQILSTSFPPNKLTTSIPGDRSSRPSKNNIKIKSNEDEYVINEEKSTTSLHYDKSLRSSTKVLSNKLTTIENYDKSQRSSTKMPSNKLTTIENDDTNQRSSTKVSSNKLTNIDKSLRYSTKVSSNKLTTIENDDTNQRSSNKVSSNKLTNIDKSLRSSTKVSSNKLTTIENYDTNQRSSNKVSSNKLTTIENDDTNQRSSTEMPSNKLTNIDDNSHRLLTEMPSNKLTNIDDKSYRSSSSLPLNKLTNIENDDTNQRSSNKVSSNKLTNIDKSLISSTAFPSNKLTTIENYDKSQRSSTKVSSNKLTNIDKSLISSTAFPSNKLTTIENDDTNQRSSNKVSSNKLTNIAKSLRYSTNTPSNKLTTIENYDKSHRLFTNVPSNKLTNIKNDDTNQRSSSSLPSKNRININKSSSSIKLDYSRIPPDSPSVSISNDLKLFTSSNKISQDLTLTLSPNNIDSITDNFSKTTTQKISTTKLKKEGYNYINPAPHSHNKPVGENPDSSSFDNSVTSKNTTVSNQPESVSSKSPIDLNKASTSTQLKSNEKESRSDLASISYSDYNASKRPSEFTTKMYTNMSSTRSKSTQTKLGENPDSSLFNNSVSSKSPVDLNKASTSTQLKSNEKESRSGFTTKIYTSMSSAKSTSTQTKLGENPDSSSFDNSVTSTSPVDLNKASTSTQLKSNEKESRSGFTTKIYTSMSSTKSTSTKTKLGENPDSSLFDNSVTSTSPVDLNKASTSTHSKSNEISKQGKASLSTQSNNSLILPTDISSLQSSTAKSKFRLGLSIPDETTGFTYKLRSTEQPFSLDDNFKTTPKLGPFVSGNNKFTTLPDKDSRVTSQQKSRNTLSIPDETTGFTDKLRSTEQVLSLDDNFKTTSGLKSFVSGNNKFPSQNIASLKTALTPKEDTQITANTLSLSDDQHITSKPIKKLTRLSSDEENPMTDKSTKQHKVEHDVNPKFTTHPEKDSHFTSQITANTLSIPDDQHITSKSTRKLTRLSSNEENHMSDNNKFTTIKQPTLTTIRDSHFTSQQKSTNTLYLSDNQHITSKSTRKLTRLSSDEENPMTDKSTKQHKDEYNFNSKFTTRPEKDSRVTSQQKSTNTLYLSDNQHITSKSTRKLTRLSSNEENHMSDNNKFTTIKQPTLTTIRDSHFTSQITANTLSIPDDQHITSKSTRKLTRLSSNEENHMSDNNKFTTIKQPTLTTIRDSRVTSQQTSTNTLSIPDDQHITSKSARKLTRLSSDEENNLADKSTKQQKDEYNFNSKFTTRPEKDSRVTSQQTSTNTLSSSNADEKTRNPSTTSRLSEKNESTAESLSSNPRPFTNNTLSSSNADEKTRNPSTTSRLSEKNESTAESLSSNPRPFTNTDLPTNLKNKIRASTAISGQNVHTNQLSGSTNKAGNLESQTTSSFHPRNLITKNKVDSTDTLKLTSISGSISTRFVKSGKDSTSTVSDGFSHFVVFTTPSGNVITRQKTPSNVYNRPKDETPLNNRSDNSKMPLSNHLTTQSINANHIEFQINSENSREISRHTTKSTTKLEGFDQTTQSTTKESNTELKNRPGRLDQTTQSTTVSPNTELKNRPEGLDQTTQSTTKESNTEQKNRPEGLDNQITKSSNRPGRLDQTTRSTLRPFNTEQRNRPGRLDQTTQSTTKESNTEQKNRPEGLDNQITKSSNRPGRLDQTTKSTTKESNTEQKNRPEGRLGQTTQYTTKLEGFDQTTQSTTISPNTELKNRPGKLDQTTQSTTISPNTELKNRPEGLDNQITKSSNRPGRLDQTTQSTTKESNTEQKNRPGRLDQTSKSTSKLKGLDQTTQSTTISPNTELKNRPGKLDQTTQSTTKESNTEQKKRPEGRFDQTSKSSNRPESISDQTTRSTSRPFNTEQKNRPGRLDQTSKSTSKLKGLDQTTQSTTISPNTELKNRPGRLDQTTQSTTVSPNTEFKNKPKGILDQTSKSTSRPSISPPTTLKPFNSDQTNSGTVTKSENFNQKDHLNNLKNQEVVGINSTPNSLNIVSTSQTSKYSQREHATSLNHLPINRNSEDSHSSRKQSARLVTSQLNNNTNLSKNPKDASHLNDNNKSTRSLLDNSIENNKKEENQLGSTTRISHSKDEIGIGSSRHPSKGFRNGGGIEVLHQKSITTPFIDKYRKSTSLPIQISGELNINDDHEKLNVKNRHTSVKPELHPKNTTQIQKDLSVLSSKGTTQVSDKFRQQDDNKHLNLEDLHSTDIPELHPKSTTQIQNDLSVLSSKGTTQVSDKFRQQDDKKELNLQNLHTTVNHLKSTSQIQKDLNVNSLSSNKPDILHSKSTTQVSDKLKQRDDNKSLNVKNRHTTVNHLKSTTQPLQVSKDDQKELNDINPSSNKPDVSHSKSTVQIQKDDEYKELNLKNHHTTATLEVLSRKSTSQPLQLSGELKISNGQKNLNRHTGAKHLNITSQPLQVSDKFKQQDDNKHLNLQNRHTGAKHLKSTSQPLQVSDKFKQQDDNKHLNLQNLHTTFIPEGSNRESTSQIQKDLKLKNLPFNRPDVLSSKSTTQISEKFKQQDDNKHLNLQNLHTTANHLKSTSQIQKDLSVLSLMSTTQISEKFKQQDDNKHLNLEDLHSTDIPEGSNRKSTSRKDLNENNPSSNKPDVSHSKSTSQISEKFRQQDDNKHLNLQNLRTTVSQPKSTSQIQKDLSVLSLMSTTQISEKFKQQDDNKHLNLEDLHSTDIPEGSNRKSTSQPLQLSGELKISNGQKKLNLKNRHTTVISEVLNRKSTSQPLQLSGELKISNGQKNLNLQNRHNTVTLEVLNRKSTSQPLQLSEELEINNNQKKLNVKNVPSNKLEKSNQDGHQKKLNLNNLPFNKPDVSSSRSTTQVSEDDNKKLNVKNLPSNKESKIVYPKDKAQIPGNLSQDDDRKSLHVKNGDTSAKPEDSKQALSLKNHPAKEESKIVYPKDKAQIPGKLSQDDEEKSLHVKNGDTSAKPEDSKQALGIKSKSYQSKKPDVAKSKNASQPLTVPGELKQNDNNETLNLQSHPSKESESANSKDKAQLPNEMKQDHKTLNLKSKNHISKKPDVANSKDKAQLPNEMKQNNNNETLNLKSHPSKESKIVYPKKSTQNDDQIKQTDENKGLKVTNNPSNKESKIVYPKKSTQNDDQIKQTDDKQKLQIKNNPSPNSKAMSLPDTMKQSDSNKTLKIQNHQPIDSKNTSLPDTMKQSDSNKTLKIQNHPSPNSKATSLPDTMKQSDSNEALSLKNHPAKDDGKIKQSDDKQKLQIKNNNKPSTAAESDDFEADDDSEPAQAAEEDKFAVEDNQVKIKKVMVHGKIVTKYFINGKEVSADELNSKHKSILKRRKRSQEVDHYLTNLITKIKQILKLKDNNYTHVIRTPKNRNKYIIP
jgi:hypothetical protein